MNRRALLLQSLAGAVGVAFAKFGRVRAQEATPAPGAGLYNIRWQLDRINSGDSVLLPDDPTRYWVQFQDDGELIIGADCNSASAVFKLTGSSVGLSEISSTRAFCGETTIVDEFLGDLKYVVSYMIVTETSDQLLLEMMADGGQLLFSPVLGGVVWQWTEFQSGDGSIVTSADPSRYTLEFQEDGTARVVADCNSGSGPANVSESSIDLAVAVTEMGCPPESQSNDFLRYVGEAVSFVIRDGQLALALPADAGIALFKPVIPVTPVATPVS